MLTENAVTRYRHVVHCNGVRILSTDSHELAELCGEDMLNLHPEHDVFIRTTEIRDDRDRLTYDTHYEL